MGLDIESAGVESDGRTHTKDVHLPIPATADDGEWNDKEAEPAPLSLEEEFDKLPLPSWKEQVTVRALVVGTLIGGFFSIITHKLSLTTGVIPSLNVAAGLIGFFFIKLWISILTGLKIWSKPFTRQENTVIQTCAVSCYGLAFSGGYGMYLIAMDKQSYLSVGNDNAGNRIQDVKDPSLGWMFALIFSTAFLGIMAIVPLRKLMILRYKLTYPSGTATAILINGFHTPMGALVAKKQVRSLLTSGGMSLFFSFFKWFFSGDGESCGFENFPTLGLKARDNKFMFDFSLVYIGAGMICPHIVNVSVLLGAILSWGILWPLIEGRAGDWYPEQYKTGSSFKGLWAYKIFLAIGLILGDGLYQFIKMLIISGVSFYKIYKESMLPQTAKGIPVLPPDEQKRVDTFLKDSIPNWMAVFGYVSLAVIAIGVIPQILPEVRWYFVLVCYIFAPILAFCNSYGMGLTDWSLTSTYGKISLFVFAAWAGSNGGVLAGLGTCGVMMTIVSAAADLMQDFKTGYLTRSSPRAMFMSQIIGTFMGCLLAPITFWMFWTAFKVGVPGSQYPAPFAVIYRQMAIIGVEGFGALPHHCLQLTAAFFVFAIVLNLIKDNLPVKYARFVPIPMAMGIPFYLGGYFAVDMFLGSVIVFVWNKLHPLQALVHVPAVASGLICGDGLWSVPSAILALTHVTPPICMAFFPTKEFIKRFGG